MVDTICGAPGTAKPGGSKMSTACHLPVKREVVVVAPPGIVGPEVQVVAEFGSEPYPSHAVALIAKIKSPVDPASIAPNGA